MTETPEIATPEATAPKTVQGALPRTGKADGKQGKQLSFESIGIIATAIAVTFALVVCIPHF